MSINAVIFISCFVFFCGLAGNTSNVEAANSTAVFTASGLQYSDLVVGKGATAKAGKVVTVHYIGALTDGVKFDSSVERRIPFVFTLGVGQVIKGWDEGVVGMRVGGRRRLIVPASLGYGSKGAGKLIPPNATLVFVVELLNVQ